MSKLYPCVYCTEDGYCKKYSDEEVTSWCVKGPCEDEKPSNGDRIRSKTDEELADFIIGIIQRGGIPFLGGKPIRWIDWLKSPVEVDDTDN